MVRPVSKYNHIPALCKQRHKPGNIKPGIRSLFLALGVKRPPVRRHPEPLRPFPIFHMGILNDTQSAMNRTRSRQIKPLARRPEAAIQNITRILDLRRISAPIRMPCHRLRPRHPDYSGRSMHGQLIRTDQMPMNIHERLMLQKRPCSRPGLDPRMACTALTRRQRALRIGAVIHRLLELLNPFRRQHILDDCKPMHLQTFAHCVQILNAKLVPISEIRLLNV